jgi:hypothetical protein
MLRCGKVLLVLALSVLASAGSVARASFEIDASTLVADGWVLGTNYWTTTTNSNLGNVTAINNAFGTSLSSISLLYKANVGNPVTEDGTAAYQAAYSTAFSPAGDEANATITYGSGSKIVETPLYLIVKDGNHSPAQYLFDITSWDRTVLTLENFWAGRGGSISNVAIWGGPNVIPEPASIAAWAGIGAIFGLGMYRRHRRKS